MEKYGSLDTPRLLLLLALYTVARAHHMLTTCRRSYRVLAASTGTFRHRGRQQRGR